MPTTDPVRDRHLHVIKRRNDNLLRAHDDLDASIRAARNAGVTWDAIGYALGSISRQAAQQRFAYIGIDQPLR